MAYDSSVARDTYDLVFRYNSKPSFRKAFDEALKSPGVVVFKRRPVKFYIFVLAKVLPEYANYYKDVRNDKSKFGDFLTLIGKNQRGELDRLQRASIPNTEIFREQERAGFLEAESEPAEFKRTQKFDRLLELPAMQTGATGPAAQKPKTLPAPAPPPSPSNVSSFKLPVAKIYGTWSSWIFVLILLIASVFLTGFNFLENSALLPPFPQETTTSRTGPGTGTAVFSDIASCQFTRGDIKPPTASYKSGRLLGYFKEASDKSGVPAVLLAAIARVESPGIVNFADTNLESFGCPTSPTGARGLMQIQPPGSIGHNSAAMALGAQYLGISADKIDLCNLRQNIFVGAAFVNTRRPGGKWDNSRVADKSYVDSVAETYYGCLKYPSCTNGPYSYGDDLWNSMQSCATLPETTAGKQKAPDVGGGSLRGTILKEFYIDMDGFSETQLKWAWEKFWDVKHTKFNKLVRGPGNTVKVQAVDAGSEQINCSLVLVRKTITDPVLFKIVLTHELAHVIYWCNDDAINRVTEHANIYVQEGAVTGYGEPVNGTTCYNTPARTENYPEMIAYYLNRGVVEQTGCNLRGQVPFANGRFPLHYNLARKILGDY